MCAHATILRNVEVAAHALVHDDSCTSRDPAAKVHQDELKEQELFAGLTARREHRGWRLTKKQHTFCDDDHNVHIGRRQVADLGRVEDPSSCLPSWPNWDHLEARDLTNVASRITPLLLAWEPAGETRSRPQHKGLASQSADGRRPANLRGEQHEGMGRPKTGLHRTS